MKKNIILFAVLLLLGALTIWVIKRNKASSIADQPFTEFAIEDTSKVTKIFIAESNGSTALIERIPGERLWRVNGKYPARQDAVELLLKTFKRLKVRGNVAETARDNMMKVLATSSKKVEVYTDGKEPEKIYYVGPATPDHIGTIMLLEIPGLGKSPDPYITHMEGFTGFLSTRFFASEMDWRYTGVFEYPGLEFKEVKMIDHFNPTNSFEVKYNGGNDIKLYAGYNPFGNAFTTDVPRFDSLAVKDFLLRFKKVHLESYQTNLKPEVSDSISRTQAAYTIEVTDNAGAVKKVDLIWKKSTHVYLDDQGKPSPWDLEYFWGRMPSGELGMAQSYTFGPLIQPLSAYLGKK